MKIHFRTVARLARGYSITVLPARGLLELPAFVAGSEGSDPLLMFEPPDFEAKVVATSPGGFISTAPLLVRGGERFVVASTEFRPGFDAATSALRVYPLDQPNGPGACVATVPYAHRVATFSAGGRDHALVSTLCAAKSFKEDWTQPGGIHLARIPDDPRSPWDLRLVVGGLNKNHGFDFARLGRNRRAGWLVSALEGLSFMPLPSNPDGAWGLERIDASETSDAFAFDWDGDGEPEVFSIAPFHGHALSIHRHRGGAWQKTLIHDDLSFGHIVWAGDLLGAPALLAGSRRNRRELRLYRPAPGGGIDLNYAVIDEGIGPSQIAVVPLGSERALLYVAAHGIDEIRIYQLDA